jgi:hypothetical protein
MINIFLRSSAYEKHIPASSEPNRYSFIRAPPSAYKTYSCLRSKEQIQTYSCLISKEHLFLHRHQHMINIFLRSSAYEKHIPASSEIEQIFVHTCTAISIENIFLPQK